MLDFFKPYLPEILSDEDVEELFIPLEERYPKNSDPWGLNLEKSKRSLKSLWPLYKSYFKVRVFGKENITDSQYMVTSNHTGQIAIDGMLISLAFLADVRPPRLLRSMAERFVTKLPFFGSWVAESGVVLGDRTNCAQLLERGESILVFPEGVPGVAKSTKDFYKLQSFTKGFMRLSAGAENVEILPIAVIGAEEFYPYIYQAKSLSKLLGLPCLPISPFFPMLGPLGLIPLPSPVDIYIGEPYKIPETLTADSSDHQINEQVYIIEEKVKDLIAIGLKNRRPFWANTKKIDVR